MAIECTSNSVHSLVAGCCKTSIDIIVRKVSCFVSIITIYSTSWNPARFPSSRTTVFCDLRLPIHSSPFPSSLWQLHADFSNSHCLQILFNLISPYFPWSSSFRYTFLQTRQFLASFRFSFFQYSHILSI